MSRRGEGTTVHKTKNGRTRVTLDCGESLTEQAHVNQCNMNIILKDYERGIINRHVNKHAGKYDDVSETDFRQAMETVAYANQMFDELPSAMRARFGNDAGSFLAFTQNPDNKAEMQKLGMLRGNDGLDLSGAATMAPVEAQEALQASASPVAESTNVDSGATGEAG